MAVRACVVVCFVTWNGRGMAVGSHCDKAGAAVLVLVLVLAVIVCVGGARFVGGVVGSRGCRSALIL
jgi:hypothetical protein